MLLVSKNKRLNGERYYIYIQTHTSVCNYISSDNEDIYAISSPRNIFVYNAVKNITFHKKIQIIFMLTKLMRNDFLLLSGVSRKSIFSLLYFLGGFRALFLMLSSSFCLSMCVRLYRLCAIVMLKLIDSWFQTCIMNFKIRFFVCKMWRWRQFLLLFVVRCFL